MKSKCCPSLSHTVTKVWHRLGQHCIAAVPAAKEKKSSFYVLVHMIPVLVNHSVALPPRQGISTWQTGLSESTDIQRLATVGLWFGVSDAADGGLGSIL
jgi:hypothetical protein